MPYVLVNSWVTADRLEEGGIIYGLSSEEVEKLQRFFPNRSGSNDYQRFCGSLDLLLVAVKELGYSIVCFCTSQCQNGNVDGTWTLRK